MSDISYDTINNSMVPRQALVYASTCDKVKASKKIENKSMSDYQIVVNMSNYWAERPDLSEEEQKRWMINRLRSVYSETKTGFERLNRIVNQIWDIFVTFFKAWSQKNKIKAQQKAITNQKSKSAKSRAWDARLELVAAQAAADMAFKIANSVVANK